ncbi:hypothetical protein [Amycolatopsis vastitatis]|uniref:hypothetical protein n=1 Tax=Amycolatopsis vastitatis TaxID=1905142 RepID=UPI00142E22AF|nr:hypothetical protein [Amycolatopsis vastitatis]
MAFPVDLADPDPVAAPAFPDGPLSPRAAPVVLAVPLARSGVPADLADPAVPAVRVVPAALAAVGPAVPAVRAAPRDPTTAALPLPCLPCGWPRRHGVAPPA